MLQIPRSLVHRYCTMTPYVFCVPIDAPIRKGIVEKQIGESQVLLVLFVMGMKYGVVLTIMCSICCGPS